MKTMSYHALINANPGYSFQLMAEDLLPSVSSNSMYSAFGKVIKSRLTTRIEDFNA